MEAGRRGVMAVSLAAVLALAGCASGLDSDRPTPTSPSVATESPRPTPTPSPTSTGPRAAVVPDQYVDVFPAQIPVDLGAREHAEGTVDLDADGVPAAYHVASDDVIDYVTARFGFHSYLPDHLDFDYLNTINQVRRGGYPWTLYAGDTLNLSPYTVTSVGDSNGIVHRDPPPSVLPPQR